MRVLLFFFVPAALAGCSLLVGADNYGAGDGDAGSPEDAGLDSGSDTDSGPVCPPGSSDCGDGCVDLQTNAAHCGRCDHACGEAERCVEGVCMACACAEGELCVAGGRCVPSRGGACTSWTCAGVPGDVPPLRVASMSVPADEALPDDLAIVAPSGEGWAMLWRSGGGLQAAYADVREGCWQAFGLDVSVGMCSGETPSSVAFLDARTDYMPAAQTVAGTAGNESGKLFHWQVTADLAMKRLGLNSNWCRDLGRQVQGLALMPRTRSMYVVTMGDPQQVHFVNGTAGTVTKDAPAVLSGEVAGSYRWGAFGLGRSVGESVAFWPHGGGTVTSEVGFADDLVAAINARTVTEKDYFVYGNDRDVVMVSCDRTNPDCAFPAPTSVPSRVSGTPLAAYAVGRQVVFFDVGGGEGDRKIRRHVVGESLRQADVLSNTIVGGRIQRVVALDAEIVLRPDRLDRVWAAFVVVERGETTSLELWTGTDRQCGGGDMAR